MNRERINWKGIIKAGNTVKIRQWDDMKKNTVFLMNVAIVVLTQAY